MRIALPQALSMVVCLLTIQVLTPFWNNDSTMTYMFNLLVGGTVSFMVVIEVCRPMNWIRRTMTVILICLFALGIMLFPGLLGIYSIFRWKCIFAVPMICMVLVISKAFTQLVLLGYRLKDWAAMKIRALSRQRRYKSIAPAYAEKKGYAGVFLWQKWWWMPVTEAAIRERCTREDRKKMTILLLPWQWEVSWRKTVGRGLHQDRRQL